VLVARASFWLGILGPWIKEHCEFSWDTAVVYMRLAKQINAGALISTARKAN